MIKKLMPVLVVLVLVAMIVALFLSLAADKKLILVKEGNLKQTPIDMIKGQFIDSDCGMVIDDLTDASQVISRSGKSWFFHDHGGLVKWLEEKEFKDSAKIWVRSRDTKRWIDAKSAYYSLSDTTAMGYGFGAYENKKELFVDFDTMRMKMLRGETFKNPNIRKQLLGN